MTVVSPNTQGRERYPDQERGSAPPRLGEQGSNRSTVPSGSTDPTAEEGDSPATADEDRTTKKVRTKEAEGSVSQSMDVVMAAQDREVPQEISAQVTPDPPTVGYPVTPEPARQEQKSSYKDMVTQGSAPSSTKDPWAEEGEPEYEDGDVMISDRDRVKVVELSNAYKTRLKKPWKRAVVIKLLGRPIGYRAHLSRLQTLWKNCGPFKVIDLERNYFVVRFWEERDYQNALLNCHWTIYGNALTVQPWRHDFRASTDRVTSAVVWVQFPDFPLDRYHSLVLSMLGNCVGSTVKVDINIENLNRAKFAKVAVCVDLTQPLAGTVCLEGETFQVRYEAPQETQIGSPTGVADQNGVSTLTPNSQRKTDTKGEWMNAPRQTRRPLKRQANGAPINAQSPAARASTNRFQALDAEQEMDFGPEARAAQSSAHSASQAALPRART
ncbi:hypothetical protein Tsubulata_033688 [Turnera subulata]|uniref:DUF4283 domain-containing protein n=1 Tax=Turnera subulata TaxID=218843 RepID=A0A9Q0F9Y4_9ROSI|nr:hypothetical protein Tsubulata_033688 [Turnera subulata]